MEGERRTSTLKGWVMCWKRETQGGREVTTGRRGEVLKRTAPFDWSQAESSESFQADVNDGDKVLVAWGRSWVGDCMGG